MIDKINIAELLKDCPKGMELDCTMFENVTFVRVDMSRKQFPIEIAVGGIRSKYLTKEGCFHDTTLSPESKCVIFPKGKTTWEGFQRPFKDGDIIFTHANCLKVGLGNTWISIFQEKRNGGVATYVDYAEDGDGFYSYNEDKGLLCMEEDIMRQRFATEEEKQKLFQSIKEHGCRWNDETKILEKLIEPKFKVGDRIRRKNSNEEYTIISISDYTYYYRLNEHCTGSLGIQLQDDYELVPNKFDITTLVPFESRVLVRSECDNLWRPAIFGFYLDNNYAPYYAVGGTCWEQCIPYEGNEHLRGKIDDCNKYFKTWE